MTSEEISQLHHSTVDLNNLPPLRDAHALLTDQSEPDLSVDLQSFPSSKSDIFKELVEKHRPKRIIEVGSWKGGSLMQWAAHAGPDCTLYSVDTWLEAASGILSSNKSYKVPQKHGHPMTYWVFLNNLHNAGIARQVVPIINTSTIGAQILEAHQITAPIIYIDGDHGYEQAHRDLKDYWELLEPGGSMLVDDLTAFPSVYAAVIQFVQEKRLWKNHRFVDNNMFALFEKPL
jgi:predicted O-methyltransferase YrrM